MVKKENKYLIFSIILITAILLDQLTKWLVYHFKIEKKFFLSVGIIRVENTGAAFGMLKGYTFVLALLGIFVIGLLFYYMKTSDLTRLEIVACSLIAGGAIGNLADRIFLGFVRDFIQVFNWFPVFNIADIAITTGAGLLVISQFKIKKK